MNRLYMSIERSKSSRIWHFSSMKRVLMICLFFLGIFADLWTNYFWNESALRWTRHTKRAFSNKIGNIYLLHTIHLINGHFDWFGLFFLLLEDMMDRERYYTIPWYVSTIHLVCQYNKMIFRRSCKKEWMNWSVRRKQVNRRLNHVEIELLCQQTLDFYWMYR